MAFYSSFSPVNRPIPSFKTSSGTSLVSNAAVLTATPSARLLEIEKTYQREDVSRIGNVLFAPYMFTSEVVGDQIYIGRKPSGAIVKRIRWAFDMPQTPNTSVPGAFINSPNASPAAFTTGSVSIGLRSTSGVLARLTDKYASAFSVTATGGPNEVTLAQYPFMPMPEIDGGVNNNIYGSVPSTLLQQEDLYLTVTAAFTGSGFGIHMFYVEFEHLHQT